MCTWLLIMCFWRQQLAIQLALLSQCRWVSPSHPASPLPPVAPDEARVSRVDPHTDTSKAFESGKRWYFRSHLGWSCLSHNLIVCFCGEGKHLLFLLANVKPTCLLMLWLGGGCGCGCGFSPTREATDGGTDSWSNRKFRPFLLADQRYPRFPLLDPE